MKADSQREIVVEIESTRLTRRRAKTHSRPCRDCRVQADFLSLQDAARLFGRLPDDIVGFANSNGCHFHIDISGNIYLCLIGFLDAMRMKAVSSGIKLIGDIS